MTIPHRRRSVVVDRVAGARSVTNVEPAFVRRQRARIRERVLGFVRWCGVASPIALVTGGSAGLGKEIARGLAAGGHRVVIASRDPARALRGADALAIDAADAWPLDLADLTSVRAVAARAARELPPIDVLILDAGVWPRRRIVTAAGLELGFAVNHVGHAALALGLVPHLRAGARVVTIASGLHARGRLAWDDPTFARDFDPLDAYARAKLANVLFALAFARRHPTLRSNAIHPGVIRTALHERPPASAITAAAAARGPLHLALAPEHAATTGRYFDQRTPRRPSPIALDRATQDRLWSLTESLISPRRR